ncbi:Band 7 protein [Corchorus olitorius]|uniref:Band 7 protein n=1 Tax=Corchorus olitorius TaxID=93759 RepID=A0A1R3HNU0_9ROSI|nr:Band 7 protein [Corchorus olitorius]
MDQQQQNRAAATRPPQPVPTPPSRPPPAQTSDFLVGFLIVVGFIVIASSALFPTAPSYKYTLSILHQVPEGHVGVYWKGGALMKEITEPGFHLKLPLITHYEPVQVTLQTDQVRDIPCGTKGGVMINFGKIEVVNRLRKEYVYETLLNYGVHYDNTWIYDKIHHEINQFCSSHTLQQVYIDVFDQIDEKMKDALQGDCTRYAPGIEILSVRVTKPIIPESIRRNYEQMEEERTKVLISVERQKVVEKEAETKKKMAVSEAEKFATVSKIQMEQKLMEKDSARRQQEIENKMYTDRQKSLADAEFYRELKEAEANKLKLTPQYLELSFINAITQNTKIFFGDKVPNMILDQRLLGNFMQNVSRQVASEGQVESDA